MKILIVGIGKTGATLARTLTNEGHDVTIQTLRGLVKFAIITM